MHGMRLMGSVGTIGATIRFLAVLGVSIPAPLAAQNLVVVGGRVMDAATGLGIQNAGVTLPGYGTVLTAAQGAFIFTGVRPGDYSISVTALGYADGALAVTIEEDVNLQIPLDVDPVALEELRVELGTLDFDGRARDPALNRNVMDADVVTDQGHTERSNTFGRFDLDDVFERIPLRLVLRGFGYLPLDTVFVPDDGERYDFPLVVDPIAEKLIDFQTNRLIERAGPFYYNDNSTLDREDMGRFRDGSSLQEIMEWTFPRRIVQRIGCFMYDERWINSREERRHILESTVTQDLQRIELFEFPGFGRLFMARIYTRRYYQRHMGDDRPMKIPVMTDQGMCV